MYTIGICDDGKNICSFLEDTILQFGKEKHIKLETEVWYTGEGLQNYLVQGNHLDILFLDIELFEMTGIEVGEFIRNHLEDRMMQIIYISGKQSYAQKLFKTQPMDFLVKPVSAEQVKETLELAIKIIGKSSQKFEFQRGKDYYYVSMGEIMYFVSEGKKVKIVTVTGVQEFYGKLKEAGKRLPDIFLNIHQSYIVNKEFIVKYTYETVEMSDGNILTISKVNRKKIRQEILQKG